VLLASGVQDLPATDLVMFDDVTSRGVGIDEFMSGSIPEDACATDQCKLASSLGTRFRTAASKTSTPRDAQDLFRCRAASAHLAKPILPQRPHTSGYGPASQFSRTAPQRKLRAELLVEQE
jgi:hypothetical protein